MKSEDEIEDEYNSFKIKTTFVNTYKEFISFMYLGIKETHEIEKDFKREIRKNNIDEVKAKLKNTLLSQNNDVSFYEYDNNLMFELITMILNYREIYINIIRIATEDNYRELLKVMDFLTKYYKDHINYFEHKRDKLEMYIKGISYNDSRYEDNQDVLYKFIDKKLTEIYTNNSSKILVKKNNEK